MPFGLLSLRYLFTPPLRAAKEYYWGGGPYRRLDLMSFITI